MARLEMYRVIEEIHAEVVAIEARIAALFAEAKALLKAHL